VTRAADTGTPRLLQGNQACALAAIAAGCRFYAGYPITPSSEIAEGMAAELPEVRGVFVQMEDEIASLAAVIGASLGGVKAMTATSGPGFSLMQEQLGFASMAEIPCVVVNVMRGGPSTGMPTRPAQGDLMQSRWGTHGDHPVIVVAPYSVSEVFLETVRAFNLSERFRVPAVVLYDEVIGHLRETVRLPAPESLAIEEREWAQGSPQGFLSYADTPGGVPPMPRPGAGYRTHTTGLTHGPDGFPTQDPAQVSAAMQRLLGKLDRRRDEIDAFEELYTEDAEVLVVAVGIVARAAERAVRLARREGLRVGLFRPVTLWPFPDSALRETASRCQAVLVAEMNAGQLVLEVGRWFHGRLEGLNRVDGEPIPPAEILAELRGLVSHA
jgi:2-oxoglutarate ferredoxin oxidoreductase subunit alpha